MSLTHCTDDEPCLDPRYARGLCRKHYARAYRAGLLPLPKRTCKIPGCVAPHKGYDLCKLHLNRQRRGLPATGPVRETICNIPGCEKPRKGAHRKCSMHLARKARHGDYDTVLKCGTKPEVPSYRAAHSRVMYARGKARDHACESCPYPAIHWAYDHTDPDPVIDEHGKIYSLDPQRYRPLCAPCHGAFDAANGGQAGGRQNKRPARAYIRHVRVDDDLWDMAKTAAKKEGMTLSAMVSAALREYLRP